MLAAIGITSPLYHAHNGGSIQRGGWAMAINMFEGARRIAKLIAVFIVLGFGIAIVTDSSRTVDLEFPYLIVEPSSPPVLGIFCRDGAKKVSTDVTTKSGVKVSADLCFLYAKPESGVLMFDDILFTIPESDEGLLNVRWWSKTLENASMYFLGMLASLAGWWAFTWTVGWIVRGFAGISRTPEAIDDGIRGAISSRWSPDKRTVIVVALASIVIGSLTLLGSKFLDRLQKDRLSTLALTGQQETMKIMEVRDAKEATDRQRELTEFRQRALREAWAAAETVDDSWVLNVSSRPGGAGNVKTDLQELARAGIPAFSETINYSDGSRTFVYGGPFSTFEAAEESQNRHRNFFGYAGSVVKRTHKRR